MTLDAQEIQQATEIAQRTTAEAIRNLWRGTGGANMPIPMVRPGTVAGRADGGAETFVKPDGDANAVPAVNACGTVVEPGDRVLVSWIPPLGVYITQRISRAHRGNWSPLNVGASSNNTNAQSIGHYTRIAHHVDVYGRYVLGAGGSFGTGASIGGLPFPVITDGLGVPAVIGGYYTDAGGGGDSYPISWIIGEGATSGQVWFHNAFGGGAVFLSPVSTALPVAQQAGNYITVQGVYDTEAQ